MHAWTRGTTVRRGIVSALAGFCPGDFDETCVTYLYLARLGEGPNPEETAYACDLGVMSVHAEVDGDCSRSGETTRALGGLKALRHWHG